MIIYGSLSILAWLRIPFLLLVLIDITVLGGILDMEFVIFFVSR